jgi:esterase/lipase superfamily enzyme
MAHRFACAVLLLVSLLAAGPATAQDRWVRMALKDVDLAAGSDEIDVSRAPGAYKAIRLQARREPIEITLVEVVYREGADWREERLIDLRAGERSRPIAPGADRFINRVELEWRGGSATERKVRIEVWGLQGPAGAAMRRPVEIVALGEVKPTPGGPARQTVSLPPNQGFDKLTLEARSGASTIRAITVVYADGGRQDVRIERRIAAGEAPGAASIEIRPEPGREISGLEIEFRIPAAERATPRPFAEIEIRGERPAAPVAFVEGEKKKKKRRAKSDEPAAAEPAERQSEPEPDSADSDTCKTSGVCTAVPVLFGTERERRDGAQRVEFGLAAAQPFALHLGRAVVTVPKTHQRGAIETPRWWNPRDWVDLMRENPARHFTIPRIQVFASEQEFIAAARAMVEEARRGNSAGDHAFIFVHGFNMTFDAALFRTAQIAYDLGSDGVPFGVPFLFSWPSRGSPDPRDYIADQGDARRSRRGLRQFLELVLNQSSARNVHVIAHSMGNVPVMELLEELAQTAPAGVGINQIVLAAPDLDIPDFERIAAAIAPRIGPEPQRLARGVTMYASSRDVALTLARRARRDVVRAGEVTERGPLVVAGIDTIDISAIAHDYFSFNHSGYASQREVLSDVGAIIRSGLRPPGARTNSLLLCTADGGAKTCVPAGNTSSVPLLSGDRAIWWEWPPSP